MEILRIHKLNEVFFQIECDDAGIKMELREHFSFFAQNYKFHPAYKARRWDGRLYLYDIRFSRLHIGLFWDFFHFCDERGYRIEFIESRHTDSYYGSLKETVTPNEVDQEDIRILDSIPFVYDELRDYQMNSVVQAITHRRQIILSATGCLDGDTEISCVIDKNDWVISFQELYDLYHKESVTIEFDTPFGFRRVIGAYIKYGPGKLIRFDDGSIIKGANNHLMMSLGEFKTLDQFVVGDTVTGKDFTEVKKIESIEELDAQEWYDFTIDDPSESYLLDGVIHHNSGKSSVIYYLSLWHIQKHQSPVLIVVPTTGLVAQMTKDFHVYAKGSLPRDFIHQIYSGQEKENINHRESPVVVSTWQSLAAIDQRNRRGGSFALKSFLQPYGMIVIDEVHTADAKSLTNILESATESNHRFGFTGTLKESKISELQLKGLLGNVYRAIHTHELQQRNELADLQIECHVLKYPAEMRQAFAKSKPEYQKEIDFILSFDERNRYICELALSLKGNTLILFQYVERHGKKIFQKLRDLCYNQPDRKLFFISGASPVEDRERMREIVEKEKNAIVVGSSQVLSTGVNIVNLENLIFASSTKSSIRVIQSIGRALRVSETKQKARLYDIVDDISWKSRKNYTLNHALKRIEFYVHEKFKYKMIDVEFDPNKLEQMNHD